MDKIPKIFRPKRIKNMIIKYGYQIIMTPKGNNVIQNKY